MASSHRTTHDQMQEIRVAVQRNVNQRQENLGDQLDGQIRRNEIRREQEHLIRLQQNESTRGTAGMLSQFAEVNGKIRQIFAQYPDLGNRLLNEFNAKLDGILENYTEGGLWEDFKKLREELQVLVVIGALGLMILIGWLSWQFVLYAWRKLMSFVSECELDPRIMSSLREIGTQILNSNAFNMFCEAIQNGQPFTMQMAQELIYSGSPVIVSIVRILLSHFSSTTN